MADKNQSSWLGGAFIAALFIGACVLVAFLQQETLDQGPGEFESVQPLGGRLLIIDRPLRRGSRYGGSTRARLNLIDVKSGLRLVRGRLEIYRPRCAPASATRLWCRSGNKVDLIDASTLDVVANKTSIAKLTSPLLAPGLYENGVAQLDRASGQIRLKLNDATWIAVSPELQVSSVPESDPGRKWDGFESAPPAPPLSPLRLTSQERAALRRGVVPVGTETFLRGKSVPVDSPALLGQDLLITYVSSLAPGAERFVARIASEGQVLWKAQLATKEITQANILEERLILFTNTEAIALSLQDGHRLWTYKY